MVYRMVYKKIRRRFSAGGGRVAINPEVDRPTTACTKPLLSAQHKAACMLRFRMALLLNSCFASVEACGSEKIWRQFTVANDFT